MNFCWKTEKIRSQFTTRSNETNPIHNSRGSFYKASRLSDFFFKIAGLQLSSSFPTLIWTGCWNEFCLQKWFPSVSTNWSWVYRNNSFARFSMKRKNKYKQNTTNYKIIILQGRWVLQYKNSFEFIIQWSRVLINMKKKHNYNQLFEKKNNNNKRTSCYFLLRTIQICIYEGRT